MSLKLGTQTRAAEVRPESLDEDGRRFTVVFSTGAAVRRWTWDGLPYLEELAMGEGNIRLGRLNDGANLLDSHGSWSLRSVLGVTEKAWMEGGKAYATVRFSQRAEVDPIWRDVREGILRSVSVGYVAHRTEKRMQDGTTVYRHIDWEPYEISLVSVPADAGAKVRCDEAAGFCEVVETGFGRRNAARLRLMGSLLRSGQHGEKQ
jgi:hypothetical protein